MSKTEPVTITIVGDGYVGKTCVLSTFLTGGIPKGGYIPTVFDTWSGSITLDTETNSKVPITLQDSAGQEEYDRLRPLMYPDTDCFIMCYCIDRKASFENITLKWIPEIRHFKPLTPIILVATKVDLRRTMKDSALISKNAGCQLAKRVGVFSFMECSALENYNVHEVIAQAVRATLAPPKKKKMNLFCNIL